MLTGWAVVQGALAVAGALVFWLLVVAIVATRVEEHRHVHRGRHQVWLHLHT